MFSRPSPRRCRPLFRGRGLASFCLIGLVLALPSLAARAPVKPDGDGREYAVVTLENGLRAVLVSDAGADKAAASLVVHAGSLDDPDAFPGLAHFLEHMLFLGTRKYPDAGGYKAFISAHGGRDNAYTGAEYTNYHFDIAPEALPEALDRFASFFVSPTLDPDYIDRERHAVDAEYRLKMRDDGRRIQQVVKETVDPSHPYSRFAVGSLETLADHDGRSLREAVRRFFETHYSADRMTLSVVAPLPIEALRRLVVERFSLIPDRGAEPRPIMAPLYRAGQRPLWIDIEPIRRLRLLRVDFSYRWRAVDRLAKPSLLIGHLLGHEGRGSLLALLKRRGWANGLSAGGGQRLGREARFSVDIDLTADGEAHRREIVGLVFAYLRMIAAQETLGRIVEELRRINALGFRFREPGAPLGEAMSLAEALQIYPPGEVLRGPYRIVGPTEERVRALLAEFVPGKAVILFVAKGVEVDRKARWYGTPYRARRPTKDDITAWRRAPAPRDLHLPAPNPFLPERLSIKPDPVPRPRPALIDAAPGYELWHRQDGGFGVPRANLFVGVQGPESLVGIRESVLLRLYADLVDDALNIETYPARLAGLHYTIGASSRGLVIQVGGYDDKIGRLLDLIVDTLAGLGPDPARFALVRERLMRSWSNRREDRPYRQAGRDLAVLLTHETWPVEARLDVLGGLTVGDLRRFLDRFRSESWVRMLVHGNLTAGEARAMGGRLRDRLLDGARPGRPARRRVVRLDPGSEYLFRRRLPGDESAVALYLQAPSDTIDDEARMVLFDHLVRAPFFNRLRTRDQLGYVVYASPMPVYRVSGEVFVVQSPRLAADALADRIDAFVRAFAEEIAEMDEMAFASRRQALVVRLGERPQRLSEQSLRYAEDLGLQYLGFDHRERLIAAVETIGRGDLAAFARRLVGRRSSRRLLVEASGGAETAAGGVRLRPGRVLVERVDVFRRSLPAYVLAPATDGGANDRKVGRTAPADGVIP